LEVLLVFALLCLCLAFLLFEFLFAAFLQIRLVLLVLFRFSVTIDLVFTVEGDAACLALELSSQVGPSFFELSGCSCSFSGRGCIFGRLGRTPTLSFQCPEAVLESLSLLIELDFSETQSLTIFLVLELKLGPQVFLLA